IKKISLLISGCYCISIYLWSKLTTIDITIDIITLSIDLSGVYLFLLITPVILVILKIYNFINLRTEYRYKIAILQILHTHKDISSISQIRKIFGKNYSLEGNLRHYILKNSKQIMKDLEALKNPLIKKKKYFYLTKYGKDLLNYFEGSNIIMKHSSSLGLEIWTKKDLKKLRR
ncbi:MAG: hypothetical protein ACFFG0_35075, partial [Candidatus Thorarchaeota archaeon]